MLHPKLPEDWPTTYFRRVQNQLAEQPNSRNNVLRLWYADGFLNVFRGQEQIRLKSGRKGWNWWNWRET